MSEFINVLEVEKLPYNQIDSLIAIDPDNKIRRTAIDIDQEVIPESTNPVSSKGVYDIIVVLGNDFGEAVRDLEDHLGEFEDDIREEISVLNEECATKEWVGDEIKNAIGEGVDLTGYATEDFVTSQNYATKSEIPNLEGYATEAYVSGLIGNIDSVLDQINGEVV